MKIKSKKIRLRNAKLAAGIILFVVSSILAAIIIYALKTNSFDWVFWVYSALAASIITGVSVSLAERIKEINGGEEDDSSQY